MIIHVIMMISAEAAFDKLDTRGVGAVRREDFFEGVVLMRVGVSDDEATRLFARLDTDGDGVVVLNMCVYIYIYTYMHVNR